MGTRADFYVGRGPEAEWLGSIAFDGYPHGNPSTVINASSEEEYRRAVANLAAELDHFTAPEDGWPWPWEDSRTTDYAYAFDAGRVWASCFGREWSPAAPWEFDDDAPKMGDDAFPDMTERKNVALGGPRSGLIIVGM